MKKNINDYGEVSKDFDKLIESLNDDIKILSRFIKKDSGQVWRRAYIKTIFSSIESIIFFMKRFIKVIQKNDDLSLSETQQKKLNEYYVIKTIHGKSRKNNYRLSFLDNVVFTIELFAYSNYIFMSIDKKCKGWKCLESSIKIRNRITHPKCSSDIFIDDPEINKVYQAYKWFYKTVIALFYDSSKTLMAQVDGLENAFSNTKESN